MRLDVLKVLKTLVSEGYSLKSHHSNSAWKSALENGEIVIKQMSESNNLCCSDDMKKDILRGYFRWHKEQGLVSFHKDSDIDDYIYSKKDSVQ